MLALCALMPIMPTGRNKYVQVTTGLKFQFLIKRGNPVVGAVPKPLGSNAQLLRYATVPPIRPP